MGFRDTILYGKSLELIEVCTDASSRFPSKYSFIGDQMMRAATSVTLNFSEGCGRQYPGDRRRYFMSARGSAHEVVAALDVAQRLRLIDTAIHGRGAQLADELGAMLTKFN